MDIASNGLNGGAFILLNSGAANFNQVVRVPFSGASVMGLLSSGDFNNDNKPDICFIQRELSYPNPLFAAVLTNNGFANNTVTFTTRTPVSLLAPDIHSGMICADFNGDGNLDAAVSVWTAGTYQGQLAVRFGNGTGNLSGSTNLPVTLTIQEAGFTPLTVPCTADFNADNKMDIAVVQYPSTQASSVKIFLGDGAGNFPTSSELSLGGSARFISTADFTGDGQTDFAVSQAPINIIPTVDIYANQAIRSDFAIRGIVAGGNGTALTLTGAASRTTTASATGIYSFSGLTNGAYTITPTLSGSVIVPASTNVTINNASLDNINFQRPQPALSLTPSLLNFGSVTLGTVSTSSLSVSGQGLASALTLAASPGAYSLSLTNSPFTTQATITLSPLNGILAPTTVFVRFTPSVTGASVGALSITGGSTASVALSGNGLNIPPPPVLKAAYAGVRSPIDPSDVQTFTITFRNAANALVDYAGGVDFRGGTPVGASTGTLALTRLSLGNYQASGRFSALGAYTLSLQSVTSTTGTRTFTVQALVNNPVPTLSSISPTSTNATTSTWTLTLNGTNFLPETEVSVNGVTLATQAVSFISGAQVKVQMPPQVAGNVSIRAFNPAPGGGLSAPQTLSVTNPAPILARIAPIGIRAGEAALLTLTGSHFTTASVVRVQRGATIATLTLQSFLSPNQATVLLPADLCTTAATYQISVQTPVFGGGISAAQNLTVLGNTAVLSEFLSVPASFVAGTNIPAFSVRFRDVYGNLTDAPIALVSFGEVTGASSGTIALTRASVGTSSATVKPFYEAGTYSLWIDGISSTTGSRSFMVTGAGDNRVTISGVPASIEAGSALPSFSLRFEDAFGNLTDNGIGRLTYTRAGGSSTATLAMTRVSLGVYTAPSTVCTIAGTYSLAVSSVNAANTLGTKTFALAPTVAARADFAGVAISIAAGTRQNAFDIGFRDVYGNLTDAGIPPNVGYSNSTNATNGVSTGTVAVGARVSLGLYDMARVTFTTAGNYTLAAAGFVNTGGRFFTVSSSTTVRFADFTLLPQKVYLFAEQKASIVYRDAYGNAIESNRTVTFTKSGIPASTGTLSLSKGTSVGETIASFSAITLPGYYTLAVSGLGASEIRTLPGNVGLPTIQVFENEGNIVNVCFEGVAPAIYAGNGLPNFTARYILNDGNPSITHPREVRYENVANPSINGIIPMRRLTFGQAQSILSPIFTVAGTYRLFVSDNAISPLCDFTFEVRGGTAASITAIAPGACIIAGQPLTGLQFAVRDRWGNLTNQFNNEVLTLAPHTGTFTATVGVSSGTISLTTSATGILTETAPRIITTSGTYTLTVPIYYSEDRVAETTATFCVEPDVAYRAVYSRVCPVIFSTETIPPVRVTVWDRYSNLANYGQTLLFSSTGTVVSAPLTRLQQGIYQTQPMTISTAGIYTLNLPSVMGTTTTTIRTGLVVSSVLSHETNAQNVFWGDATVVAVLRRGIEFGRIRAGETSPSQVATFYFSYNDILASDNTSSYTMRVVNVPRGIEFSVDSGRTYQTWNNAPVEFQRQYFKWERLKNAPWVPRDPVFVAPIYIRAMSSAADSINAFITVELSTCLGTRLRDSVRLTARWIEERITSDVQRVDMPDLFTAGATVTEVVNINYENVNTLTIAAPTGFLVSTPTCSTPAATCTVAGGASGSVAVSVHLTATNAVNYFGALRVSGATAFSAIPLAGTRYDAAVYTDSIPKVQMLVLYSPLANTFILNENNRPANDPYCVWKQQYKFGRDIFDYIAQNIDLSNQTNYNSGAFIRFGLDPVIMATTATVNVGGMPRPIFPLHDGPGSSFNRLFGPLQDLMRTPGTALNQHQNTVGADMVAYIGDPDIVGDGAAQAFLIEAIKREDSGFMIDMNRCNVDSFVWAHEAGHLFGGHHHDDPFFDRTSLLRSKGIMLSLYTLEGAMCDLPAGKIVNLGTIMAQVDPGRIPHWSDPDHGFYRAPQTRQIYPTSRDEQDVWNFSFSPNERRMVNNGGARVARFYREDIDAYITGQPMMSNGGTRTFSAVALRGFTKQFGPSQQQAISGATGQTYAYTMSGSEKQVMLRVVITDATGRRVTAEKFITCRDCTPAAMRLAARSASPFASAEAGFTATSALFSSGFSCGTGVNSSAANNRLKGASMMQGLVQDDRIASQIQMAQEESSEAIPSVTRLEQNTPNPFEHETTIHFGLSKPSTISLTIYDVFGRVVMNVLEKQRLNAGKHSFVVIMTSLPSGTYSYRLMTDEGVYTRQMKLIH
ncbi:MAG: FG-GAP-like repeat-containing protein [Candidatus Kapabacteria bacterium]|nr:FG-GAP-like repeat-containing protein [Candidatus Kapabacteria bacterium]